MLFLIPDTWYLVSDIWYLIPDIWYLIPDIWISGHLDIWIFGYLDLARLVHAKATHGVKNRFEARVSEVL